MYDFAKDSPPDQEAITARFARMRGAKQRETWRVPAELAEAEIQRRVEKPGSVLDAALEL